MRSPPLLTLFGLLATLSTSAELPETTSDAVNHIAKTFQGRGVMADDTPPTPPDAIQATFSLRPGFSIDLMAAEPDVAQPLSASWDSQGRLWVVQYLQYPFPAGLKIVSYDTHLRAQFDQVPPPPPRGQKGADKITVFEDTDADGFFDHSFDAISGLNITSSVLTGMDRLWVLNPPYLLSYPDPNGDGRPDGDPRVELSGFGIEDTHSIATSLTWGMDGWLYGANGSTTTAKVSSAASHNIQWEGQCIWRYHPHQQTFEIFAEGGGNTFSLDIDSKGRVFSGTNNGGTRGMHYEQGGYGIKGWGKHGPLTNPYAFGWFEHMSHEGDDRRFAQAFTVYEGGLLGSDCEGRIMAPNSLHNLVHLSQRLPDGSTFRTLDEAPLLTSTDRWFRPVWSGVGPDGALYLADWYDTRLSHVSPIDDWDKARGRIYRIRPSHKVPSLAPFNLHSAPPETLLHHLSHPNEWFRKQAVLEIGWRGLTELSDHLVAPPLTLEKLWALDLLDQATGGTDESVHPACQQALTHAFHSQDPYLRRWAIKMIGEAGPSSLGLNLLTPLQSETHPEVLAQILATAKRLPAKVALPLLIAADNTTDARLPLLAWWALESKADTERHAVITFLQREPSFVDSQLFRHHLAEKLARRYALAGQADDLASCASLLALAPDDALRKKIIAGLAAAFEGSALPPLPESLSHALHEFLSEQADSNLTLALQTGQRDALPKALKALQTSSTPNPQRIALAHTLADLNLREAIPVFVKLLTTPTTAPGLKRSLIQAASRFDDTTVPSTILTHYERHIAGDRAVREDALRMMTTRRDWALQLTAAVDAWQIPAKHLTLEIVRALSLHHDPVIDAAITRHWQQLLIAAPTAEKDAEAKRLRVALSSKTGDLTAGKTHFTLRCGTCHQLFGEGARVGPDLTPYDRSNADFWIDNLLHPSLEIREGFGAYILQTTSGQLLSGIIETQDAAGITLKDTAGNLTAIRKSNIASLRASPASLMPEGLTLDLNEQQIRDLFAYLMQPL